MPVPPPPTLLTIDTITGAPTYQQVIGVRDEIHVAFEVTTDWVEARFTPRFDDTFVFLGRIEGDRLVLLPTSDGLRAAAEYNGTVRTLSIARMELDAHRVSDVAVTFGSRVRFFGTHTQLDNDLGSHAMIEGDATLGDDLTPPRTRLERRFVEERYATPRLPVETPGLTYPLPPWAPIALQFSEPVTPANVVASIRVSDGVTSLPFHLVDEPSPRTLLELVPDTWWRSAVMLTVEVASFEDLAGNTSEPATLDVIGADYETGTIFGETAVPIEAGCSTSDDCIAFQGGGCDNAGGAIVRTGPEVDVRVLAPEPPIWPPSVHVEITQGDLGSAPTHHEIDAAYGSDTGWMTFALPSPPTGPPVLSIDIEPYNCWAQDRYAVPVTVVVRR